MMILIWLTSCEKLGKVMRYEVRSSSPGSTMIQWTTANGGFSGAILDDGQWSSVGGVWVHSFEAKKGFEVNVIASSPGTVEVALLIDGKLKQSATGSASVPAEINYKL